jgi:hypothetical protein
MPAIDVKGFNQFQNEVLVIDTNLNDELDPKDEIIAVSFEGFRRGQKVPADHPRLQELKARYLAFLQNRG